MFYRYKEIKQIISIKKDWVTSLQSVNPSPSLSLSVTNFGNSLPLPLGDVLFERSLLAITRCVIISLCNDKIKSDIKKI